MNALIEIFTNPKAVFDAQSEDSSWFVPALIIMAFGILSAIVVSLTLDQEAIVRAQMEQMGQSGMAQAEIDQAVAMATNPITLIGGSAIVVVVVFFVMILLHAVYYMVVGKIVGAEYDFSDWLAFSVWGRMPLVVGAIVTVVAASIIGEQTDPNAYNVLSFAAWMPVPNADHMFVGDFMNSLSLIVLWSIAVMTIGFNSWTEQGIPVSLAIVAAPYVVIYGALMAI